MKYKLKIINKIKNYPQIFNYNYIRTIIINNNNKIILNNYIQ